jgi:hypothetical protein
MEPHSRTEDTPRSRTVLEGQLRECFGRVVYSHKTHEKCADILLARLNRIKVAQIVLAALTTGGFLATVFGAGTITTVIGAVCSTALLALNAYTKSFDHGELAQKHKQVASELWLIREKYLSLLTDLAMGEKPIEALQASRDELLQNLHTAYASAPATNSASYAEAQKALKFREDLTFTDGEIDAFLPKALKRGEGQQK